MSFLRNPSRTESGEIASLDNEMDLEEKAEFLEFIFETTVSKILWQ